MKMGLGLVQCAVLLTSLILPPGPQPFQGPWLRNETLVLGLCLTNIIAISLVPQRASLHLYGSGDSKLIFKSSSRSLMGLNAALNMIDPESKQFFIRRTARELIWGYDDTLSTFARLVIIPVKRHKYLEIILHSV